MFDLFNHRGRDVAEAAASAAVEYADADPLDSAASPFALLHRGDARVVERTLWRLDDPRTVRVFEYRYEHSSGGRREVSALDTCATAVVNASWPELIVTPHPLQDLREELVTGGDEVHLESEEFGAAFRVHSTDERFAWAFLDASMQQFLLDKGRALTLELRGAWLLVYAESIPAQLLPRLFPYVDELLDTVADVVASLYPPPLPGGLATPMPRPADALAEAAGSDDELRSAQHNADLVMQHTPTFWRGAAGFGGGAAVGQAAAEVAIQAEIMADPAWRSLDESPLDALAQPDAGVAGAPEYDLDGHVMAPHHEDAWGKGRADGPDEGAVT